MFEYKGLLTNDIALSSSWASALLSQKAEESTAQTFYITDINVVVKVKCLLVSYQLKMHHF